MRIHAAKCVLLTQRQLLQRLDSLLPQLCYFSCENGFRCGGRIDTVGLDGDNDTSSDLEEQMCVQPDDTCLIGLRNICEDDIDHGDQHSVAERVTGIFDDWDNVCAVSGHVDQITTGSVGELDSKDSSGRTNDISDVGNGCSRSSTKVKDFGTWLDEDFIQTTENTSSQLGSERIPYTVFGLGCARSSIRVCWAWVVDTNALLAVD